MSVESKQGTIEDIDQNRNARVGYIVGACNAVVTGYTEKGVKVHTFPEPVVCKECYFKEKCSEVKLA